MSRSYWIAGIAFGLALLISVGHAQNHDESSSQPANYTEPAHSIPQPLAVVVSQEEGERQASHDVQEEANRWNEQNVLAQQGIERATNALKWAAIWQTGLMALGTIALVITLCVTRRAATDAAAAYRVDRRAYVMMEPPDFRPEDMQRIYKGETVPLVCTVRNSGRGPAAIEEIRRFWCASPRETNPAPIGQSDDPHRFHFPIGPNGLSPPINADFQPLRDIRTGEQWVYFMGYVIFREEDGTRYRSGFCYVYRPDMPSLGFHVARIGPQSHKYWYQTKL